MRRGVLEMGGHAVVLDTGAVGLLADRVRGLALLTRAGENNIGSARRASRNWLLLAGGLPGYRPPADPDGILPVTETRAATPQPAVPPLHSEALVTVRGD
jgi:hypothetical protein